MDIIILNSGICDQSALRKLNFGLHGVQKMFFRLAKKKFGRLVQF